MKIKITTVLLFIAVLGFSQNGKIQVEISNIKNTNGDIGLALYNNETDFTKKEFKTAKVSAKKGLVTAKFDNIPPGNYAIAVLHDANANNKMDFNLVGIPKESYGFSNNAKGILAPPKFKDAAFRVKAGQTAVQKIKLN